MSDQDLVKVVKKTTPKKLAVRLLSLSAAERNQRIGEYNKQKGCKDETKGGVIATLDGDYDSGSQLIKLSYTAKAKDPTNWLDGLWFSIANGPNGDGGNLACSICNISAASAGSEMSGAMAYTAVDPSKLEPVVTLFLSVTPKGGSTVTFTKEIQIT